MTPAETARNQRRKDYFREYARTHREQRKEIKKRWRERNKEKIAASAREYRATHPRSPSKPRKPSEPKPKQSLADLRAKFLAYRAKANA